MENKENILKIFEDFYGSQNAQKYAQDIADADKLFSDNPAPKPSEDIIRQVMARVDAVLAAKRSKQLKLSFIRLASVAAVIILGLAVTMNIIENRTERNVIAPVAEESDFQQLDTIAAQLAEAENYSIEISYYANDNFFTNENGSENTDPYDLEG